MDSWGIEVGNLTNFFFRDESQPEQPQPDLSDRISKLEKRIEQLEERSAQNARLLNILIKQMEQKDNG